jgi:hypothetical protein
MDGPGVTKVTRRPYLTGGAATPSPETGAAGTSKPHHRPMQIIGLGALDLHRCELADPERAA